MVHSKGKLSPPHIRPEMCAHYHRRQHLPETTLTQPETTAGILYLSPPPDHLVVDSEPPPPPRE